MSKYIDNYVYANQNNLYYGKPISPHDWRQDDPTDRILYQIAKEIAYVEPALRGLDPQTIAHIVEIVQKSIPGKSTLFNYEDLFHQAMAELEIALEGQEMVPDVVYLFDKWKRALAAT